MRGRDVGGFVEGAGARIDSEVSLPPGYFVRFGGQFENLVRARTRLMIVVPLALILTLLYFYGRIVDAARTTCHSRLWRRSSSLARDLPFSISAGVGFTLFGIGSGRHGARFHRAAASGGRALRDAVEAVAEQRLRPVLMTALVASLGFVPMAISTGAGAEVQRPLATVVIGGILSSTVLTLIVLPVLYALVERRTERRAR